MNILMNYICKPLVIIGALNWGLVGAFHWNLVSFIFGMGVLANIIYILVGISALCLIADMANPTNESKHSRNMD